MSDTEASSLVSWILRPSPQHITVDRDAAVDDQSIMWRCTPAGALTEFTETLKFPTVQRCSRWTVMVNVWPSEVQSWLPDLWFIHSFTWFQLASIYFYICSYNLLDYIREQDDLADFGTRLVILNDMNFWACWTKCPNLIELLQSAAASAEDSCFKPPCSVSWEAASCFSAHKEDAALYFYI